MFIAIDARADVTGSKKGKLTPAQHAQLNAWCLASKTGILDFPKNHSVPGRCEATALNITNIQNHEAKITFNKGYIVICGRLVECEDNTIFVMSTPASPSVTQTGKIILRYNLSNFGNNEFVITTKTGDLVQEDLNDNPSTGIYEFELYSYTATSSSVVLTRTNTDYIPDIGGKLEQFITILTGTGVVGSGNPPLQGYNTEKGTIEERLDALGFKEGSVTLSNGTATENFVYRQGNYVIGKVIGSLGKNISGTSGNFELGVLPEGFRPTTEQKVGVMFPPDSNPYISFGRPEYAKISTDGKITIYWWRANTQASAYSIAINGINFGFEAPPIN